MPGYGYNLLFIYHQEESKYHGGVTGFIQLLNKEPEITFKEDTSIDFTESSPNQSLESFRMEKCPEKEFGRVAKLFGINAGMRIKRLLCFYRDFQIIGAALKADEARHVF